MGLNAIKPVSGFVNSKGADQPAHPSRLISAFVICFLENVISQLQGCGNSKIFDLSRGK